MIKELNFEISKTDKNGNPLEVKLTAIGDFGDLHKAFRELSQNVMKANEEKK